MVDQPEVALVRRGRASRLRLRASGETAKRRLADLVQLTGHAQRFAKQSREEALGDTRTRSPGRHGWSPPARPNAALISPLSFPFLAVPSAERISTISSTSVGSGGGHVFRVHNRAIGHSVIVKVRSMIAPSAMTLGPQVFSSVPLPSALSALTLTVTVSPFATA